jgi:hypothetical protein
MIYKQRQCTPARHSLVDPSLTTNADMLQILSFFEKYGVVTCPFLRVGVDMVRGQVRDERRKESSILGR